jgi:hypothetical protein
MKIKELEKVDRPREKLEKNKFIKSN